LLLIDEVAEDGEYHEEALEAAKDDFIAERLGSLDIEDGEERASKLDDGVVKWAKLVCLNIAYVSNGTTKTRETLSLTAEDILFSFAPCWIATTFAALTNTSIAHAKPSPMI
jgi:hypothetical protein